MLVLIGRGVVLLGFLSATSARWPGELDEAARGLAARDRETRLQAFDTLFETDSESARVLLREPLDDPDPAVRHTAARLLVARRDQAGLDLVARWIASGSTADRMAGLEALRLAHPIPEAAKRAVVRALADSDLNVRLTALEALTGAPLGDAVSRIAALLDDPATAVRVRAVRLLAESGDRRATLPLVARLGDPDRQIQLEAMAALGTLRDDRCVPALLRVIDEGPDERRTAAIDAVAALTTEAAVPRLSRLAGHRPADANARQAQRALGEIGGDTADAMLLHLMRTPPVSDETKEALGRRSAALLQDLLEGLDDERTAIDAASVLGRHKDLRAVDRLVGVVRRGSVATPVALQALGEIGSADALPLLIDAAQDAVASTRRLALEALARIADARTSMVLPAALADPALSVRQAAMALAARVSTPDEAPLLVKNLWDPDRVVREGALAALARLGAPATAPGLVAALPLFAGSENSVGDALVVSARAADLRLLLQAAETATPETTTALVRGLSAALRDAVRQPGTADAEAVRLAVAELGRRLVAAGSVGELAADGLANGLPDQLTVPAWRAAFDTASSAVRARLCPLLVATADGTARLGQLVDNRWEDPEVQAAAAWALASSSEPSSRAALQRATQATHPAVAANARAALAEQSSKPNLERPTPLRFTTASGQPVQGRWMTAKLDEARTIWLRTGALGQISCPHLPGAATALTTGAAAP